MNQIRSPTRRCGIGCGKKYYSTKNIAQEEKAWFTKVVIVTKWSRHLVSTLYDRGDGQLRDPTLIYATCYVMGNR